MLRPRVMVDPNRVVVPIVMLTFGVFALVWPLFRARRRTGRTGFVVHRTPSTTQRLVGALVGLSHLGVLGFAVAIAVFGSTPLSVRVTASTLRIFGWVVMFGSIALVVAAQAQMGTSWRIGIDRDATDLVTHGIYGYVRNPIYSGMTAVVVGMALAAPCAWSIVNAVVVFVAIEAQARCEERHLSKQHGDSFHSYAARVGRFVPGIGKVREHAR